LSIPPTITSSIFKIIIIIIIIILLQISEPMISLAWPTGHSSSSLLSTYQVKAGVSDIQEGPEGIGGPVLEQSITWFPFTPEIEEDGNDIQRNREEGWKQEHSGLVPATNGNSGGSTCALLWNCLLTSFNQSVEEGMVMVLRERPTIFTEWQSPANVGRGAYCQQLSNRLKQCLPLLHCAL